MESEYWILVKGWKPTQNDLFNLSSSKSSFCTADRRFCPLWRCMRGGTGGRTLRQWTKGGRCLVQDLDLTDLHATFRDLADTLKCFYKYYKVLQIERTSTTGSHSLGSSRARFLGIFLVSVFVTVSKEFCLLIFWSKRLASAILLRNRILRYSLRLDIIVVGGKIR